MWAAAVLEQAISMTGHVAWDVTIAAVQARCLSSESGAWSVDGGKVPNVAAASVNRFPVQYIDSAVSRGAIIQDKWFTRFVNTFLMISRITLIPTNAGPTVSVMRAAPARS